MVSQGKGTQLGPAPGFIIDGGYRDTNTKKKYIMKNQTPLLHTMKGEAWCPAPFVAHLSSHARISARRCSPASRQHFPPLPAPFSWLKLSRSCLPSSKPIAPWLGKHPKSQAPTGIPMGTPLPLSSRAAGLGFCCSFRSILQVFSACLQK